MTHKLLLMFAILSITFIGCGKKQEEPKKQVKREVVKPVPIPVKDTVVVVDEPKPIVKKPDNKYFLIAASFVKETNANKFKTKLIDQGYDSEIIVRDKGRNKDFYKVSYKGFADRDLAFKELANEKHASTYEGVWLLINE